MGVLDFFKRRTGGAKERIDPYSNPLHEAVCAEVPAVVDGEETVIQFRWIKNSQAQIKGAQATFSYQGQPVPVVVSAPSADSFSIGINIGLAKTLMPSFHEELDRLREEGSVTPQALLSYNSAYNQAILYRRSNEELKKGNVDGWRNVLSGNVQPLVDDFEAVMPFVMRCYGE